MEQQHPPHPSMQRLLEFVAETTRQTRSPIVDFAGIGARLNVSPAVMTNWKRRGISKEGALDAEQQFGCSAVWLLTGKGKSVGSLSEPALRRASMWEHLGSSGRELFDKALDMAMLTERLAAREPVPRFSVDLPEPAPGDRTQSKRSRARRR